MNTTLEKITSWASMMLSFHRIGQTIEQEETKMRGMYLGMAVTETFPNGSKRNAIIKQIDYCPSCGLHGNFLMWIEYQDDKSYISGAWVSRDVLTLKEAE